MRAILYVNGKGGNADECNFYKPLFKDCFVCGLDYKGNTPWQAGKEINSAVRNLKKEYDDVTIIAVSIGTYFTLHSKIDDLIDRAYFISPLIDMQRMINSLLTASGKTEADLKRLKIIQTDFGEDLSWKYLSYVRKNPIRWNAKTFVLYAEKDELIPSETVYEFTVTHGASLKVMKGGEHWVHTDKQLAFLSDWICECEGV